LRSKAITSRTTRSDWVSIAAILSPIAIFLALIAVPRLPGDATIEFVKANWGSIASVWGLGVSIYVLFVAKGARKAAEDARAAERLRTALEEMEDAEEKCNQVGLFARVPKWELVQLRAEEVMSICRATNARWGEDPSLTETRNNLLLVAALMRSIIEEASKPKVSLKNILNAQLDGKEKLTAIVGQIHKSEESRSK